MSVYLILCFLTIVVVYLWTPNLDLTYDEDPQLLNMIKTLLAVSAVQLILHFTLFIMACIETHRRRRYGRKIVYLVAAPNPADTLLSSNSPGQPTQEMMEAVPIPQLSHRHQ